MLQSSCLREALFFFKLYCGPFAVEFQGKTIKHAKVNQAMESIMRKGSRKPAIHQLCLKLFLACQQLSITLLPVWRRRSEAEMVVADRGSRGP